MKVGSLFSGIAGFDLAFQQAGAKVVWAVEIDKDCRRVLKHHFPDMEIFEDVKKAGSHNLAKVNVLTGGFPCQDLSVAGKRAGLDGERSGLWFEFHRIIRELSPEWVLIENVPGLLSSNGGRDFAVILSGLAELGYFTAWRILDAQYFGVPQRRRRVFIVASLGNGRCAQVLFESSCGCGDTPPSREKGEATAGTLGGGSTESRRGWRNDLDSQGAYVPVGFNYKECNSEKSLTPTLSGGGGGGFGDGMCVAYGGNRSSGPIDKATACNAHGGTGRCDFESETFVVAPPLTSNPYGDHESREGLLAIQDCREIEKSQNGLGINQEGVAYTVDQTGSQGVMKNMMVRRLTPTECLRLQGFPDNWLPLTPSLSDSAKYRMTGNAVAVPVVRWIAKRILDQINGGNVQGGR